MGQVPTRDVAWSAPPDQRPGGDLLVPVSVVDGIVLVVWSLAGQLVAGAVVGIGLGLAGIDPTDLLGPSLGAVTVVVQSLVLAGAFAWLVGRGSWSWRLFGVVRPELRHVGGGLLGGLLAFALSGAVITAGDQLVGPLDSPGQALLESEMLAGPALVLTAVAAALLAPLLEELTFRGVLFQALGRRSTWVVGALASAAIFSVVHLEVLFPLRLESLVFGLALFTVGLVFAVLFHRTRSLVTAMVAHATFNGVQILLAAQGPAAWLGFAAVGPGA